MRDHLLGVLTDLDTLIGRDVERGGRFGEGNTGRSGGIRRFGQRVQRPHGQSRGDQAENPCY